MPYQIIDNVAYGSAKLEIKEVLEKLPEFFDGLHVVVTYMDSGRAIRPVASAVAYLGDGIGLNYACDPKFAETIEAMPDLETYHLRVLPSRLDRSGAFDAQIIGPIDINKRSISL